MRRALAAGLLIAFAVSALVWLWVQRAPIRNAIVRGGAGPPTVVLLHGYGSRAEDWLQFVDRIQPPDNARLIFPQAPLRGLFVERRGWWWLRDGLRGQRMPLPDFSGVNPGGIKIASRRMRDFLGTVNGPIILGGFSQGAMLSAEVAFHTDQDLAGLVMLAGTTVNEAAWVERFAGRRRMPIFIAHGRADRVLPFAIAERFAGRLRSAGLNVTWYPFDGGHGIPGDVVQALNSWFQQLQFAF